MRFVNSLRGWYQSHNTTYASVNDSQVTEKKKTKRSKRRQHLGFQNLTAQQLSLRSPLARSVTVLLPNVLLWRHRHGARMIMTTGYRGGIGSPGQTGYRHRIFIWPVSRSRKIILQQQDIWIIVWIIMNGHFFVGVDTFLQIRCDIFRWKLQRSEAFLNLELHDKCAFPASREM